MEFRDGLWDTVFLADLFACPAAGLLTGGPVCARQYGIWFGENMGPGAGAGWAPTRTGPVAQSVRAVDS